MRLGLVIAEIGERNSIKVTDEEINRAVIERARQFPGREQEVWDFYRNNPEALASLRAPIFEDKVVDFLLELAKVTEKTVSREELYKDDDEPRPRADRRHAGLPRGRLARIPGDLSAESIRALRICRGKA